MKKIYTLFLIVLTISCDHQRDEANSNNIILVETEIDKGLPLSILFKDVCYLQLRSNESFLIGGIQKVIMNYDRIFILDPITDAILIFNNSGILLKNLHKTGRGPGEFLNIDDFIIDSSAQNIELLDNGNRKILKFDYNGIFQEERSFNYSAENMYKFSNNLYAFAACNYLNPEIFGTKSDNIILLDSVNLLVKSYLPIDLPYFKFTNPNCFVHYKNGVNAISPFNDNIYHITNNECRLTYKIIFTNFSIPKETFKKYSQFDLNNQQAVSSAFISFANEINNNSYASGIHNIFENNQIFFFQYLIPKKGEYSVFFNKKTKEVLAGIPENDLDLGLFGEPIGIKNDTLYTFINSRDLFARVKAVNNDNTLNKSNYYFTKLNELIDTLHDSENPIILKFVIK